MKAMNNKLSKLMHVLIGHPEKFPIKQRFYSLVSCTMFSCSVLSFIFIYVIDLDIYIKFVNGIAIILFGLLYVQIRHGKRREVVENLIPLIVYILFSVFYVINNGTYGPMLYFFVIVIILFTGFKFNNSTVFLIIGIINIILLVSYEYYFPDRITDYDNRLTRLVDIFFVVFIIIIGGHIAFRVHITNYFRERDKAISQKKLIEDMLEKESRINQMKLNFFTNVSHEFRTPLSLITAPVEKLIVAEKDQAKKEQYELIKRNAYKINELVDQLLAFRKMDINKMQLELHESDIVLFTNQLVQSFLSLGDKRKIDLSFNSFKAGFKLWLDWEKIENVLTNILSNAFKFTPENGRISCEITHHPVGSGFIESTVPNVIPGQEFIQISITDTGKGIPGEHIHDIFEPFYQVPDTRYGTGLGLALASEYVKMHRGTIYAESNPGEGASFHVQLPVNLNKQFPGAILKSEPAKREPAFETERSVEYDFSERKSDTKARVSGKAGKKLKVLIVEDNLEILKYLEDELSDSYTIYKAVNGKEGINIAIEILPDLIISDIMMPETDGLTLCQRVKDIDHTSHIPVILLTARASTEHKIDGFETGADDYITKPFNMDELRARVKNLIIQRQRLREKFINELLTVKPKDMATSSKDEQFLQKAFSVVNENMNDPGFGVTEFITKVGQSRSFVHKKLKHLTDQSASEFISSLRIKKATEILQDKSKTISEVCYEVGFNDYAYFSRKFKKLFGKSPRHYFQ